MPLPESVPEDTRQKCLETFDCQVGMLYGLKHHQDFVFTFDRRMKRHLVCTGVEVQENNTFPALSMTLSVFCLRLN